MRIFFSTPSIIIKLLETMKVVENMPSSTSWWSKRLFLRIYLKSSYINRCICPGNIAMIMRNQYLICCFVRWAVQAQPGFLEILIKTHPPCLKQCHVFLKLLLIIQSDGESFESRCPESSIKPNLFCVTRAQAPEEKALSITILIYHKNALIGNQGAAILLHSITLTYYCSCWLRHR